MNECTWLKEFSAAISICDKQGVLLDMNDAAEIVFEEDGGRELLGRNILDCHPEPARSKLAHIMDAQEVNVYTIEKNGKKKLIYQAPWYKEGEFAGFVEFSVDIPFNLPHFIRS